MATTLERENQGDSDYVLSKSLGGGPLGLGDPDDRSLRKAEREILIPAKMKEKAKRLKCASEVKDFGECAKQQGLMMPFMCRPKAKALEECLKAAYSDPAFINLCTEEFLDERSHYRKTGIKAKEKKKDAAL
ncbi:cox assembly mitochondrial protein like protein [Plakobranchus ocellatus]|uniref:COX assembly mitochondrial protein n=1 Tax=Plakobranchus ocellatus TaxID=259542 RepID=A0AAV4A2L1_9GAST|nr:cox assembly mitochondrial protein like protein [Plakobranchus ocellatus]